MYRVQMNAPVLTTLEAVICLCCGVWMLETKGVPWGDHRKMMFCGECPRM